MKSALNRVLIPAQNVEEKWCRTAPESWIYKTKITFWWQNNEKLEIRSRCHILSVNYLAVTGAKFGANKGANGEARGSQGAVGERVPEGWATYPTAYSDPPPFAQAAVRG